MATNITLAGGNTSSDINIYGNGSVYGPSANGKDTVYVSSNGQVTIGNGNDSITVGGAGTIIAGTGKDTISVTGNASITASGHDTINLGSSHDTINLTAGKATVTGTFGSASLSGGETLTIGTTGAVYDVTTGTPAGGSATLLGGSNQTEFVNGGGKVTMLGGTANDTFIGGAGGDTMTGGSGPNFFAFNDTAAGGQHLITNYASTDKLYLGGWDGKNTLQDPAPAGDSIAISGGNTVIHLAGGTVITLEGYTGSLDITKHKP